MLSGCADNELSKEIYNTETKKSSGVLTTNLCNLLTQQKYLLRINVLLRSLNNLLLSYNQTPIFSSSSKIIISNRFMIP
jgi:hypothetical protein